jgi:hypothetical protein
MKKPRSYKQVTRSAVRANLKAIAELEEALPLAPTAEQQREVADALGAARVLSVVLGNILFDAEGP